MIIHCFFPVFLVKAVEIQIVGQYPALAVRVHSRLTLEGGRRIVVSMRKERGEGRETVGDEVLGIP